MTALRRLIALSTLGVLAASCASGPAVPATSRTPATATTGIAEPTNRAESLAPTSTPTPAPVPVAPSTPPVAAPLSTLFSELAVAPEHRTGYDRDLFPLWIDADHDGCNTRYEVLIADAVTPPTISGTCHLTGGSWFSTYDGKTLDGAAQVEIDHVVALAEAWYSGAWDWTTARREQYANDLGVPWTLVPSSHSSNQSKGSNDPAEWIPPRAADVCPYVSSWIEIKVRWGLTIDRAEHDALQRYLSGCPDEVVVVPRVPAQATIGTKPG
ncbi:MAG TPA: HNH endonuclease family protein [Candidatus Limnocylindrales bacterium]